MSLSTGPRFLNLVHKPLCRFSMYRFQIGVPVLYAFGFVEALERKVAHLVAAW